MSFSFDPIVSDLMGWLTDSALPLWWEQGGDHGRGGFYEALDHTGNPVQADRRARVQTRQVYAYATAGALGWNGPWREAMEHGLAFFLDNYPRADGLYRTLVSPDGACVDDTAWLYDQAFALFAMAQAARAGSARADLRDRACSLRQALQAWRLPEGGFLEPPATHTRQANPHMHLLEAALAWSQIDGDPHWNALADEIVGLAMTRFIDRNGALHEFFTRDWVLAQGEDGRVVEPGHLFEWAWLLERWARLRGRDDVHRAAVRMFEIGRLHGVDPVRGVAFDQMLDDFTPHQTHARLWPQTERIKAAVILGEDAEAVKAVSGLKLYLDTPVAGLWRDKLRPDGSFVDEPAPASSFYHVICAIAEMKAVALQYVR